MGVNNRARRAAKQRKRAKAGSRPGPGGFGPTAEFDEKLLAGELVHDALEEVCRDLTKARSQAVWLLRNERSVSARVLLGEVKGWLGRVVTAVVQGGWTPSDLAEIVRRRLDEEHLPSLAALLAAEAARHPAGRVSVLWWEDLARLGEAGAADLRKVSGLEQGLGLVGVLSMLPRVTQVLPPPGSQHETGRTQAAHVDDKQLSKVRALLAKAESTDFAEEAEALSAKAQELISRYALDRLVKRTEEAVGDRSAVARRLWIDAPYVLAKAQLIEAVARANRCRSVVSEQLGFSTVVGEPADIDSVELVSTSLLVQASTAMHHHGRQVDGRGTSRTRSFRNSFLIAYAARIGERLQAATQHATEETGRTDVLLPALRQQEQEVDEACEEMFPDAVLREATISNSKGWAAGRASADLALLDVNLQVTPATS